MDNVKLIQSQIKELINSAKPGKERGFQVYAEVIITSALRNCAEILSSKLGRVLPKHAYFNANRGPQRRCLFTVARPGV